jgi:transcription elongation factor Elf1
MSDYDSWKLATPWDDEVSRMVDFDCSECDSYNKSVEVVVGRRDEEAEAECESCGHMNWVDL